MAGLAVLIAHAASAQLAIQVTITNLSGRVYSDVTLDHTNNLGIVWNKPDGSEGILRYKDLPADVLARYGVNAHTVQAAVAAEQKAKAEWDARARADAEHERAMAAMAGSSQMVTITAILDDNSHGGIPVCETGGGGGLGNPVPRQMLVKNLDDSVRAYLRGYEQLKAQIVAYENQPITVTASASLSNPDGSPDQYGSTLAARSAADDALDRAARAKDDQLDRMKSRLREMEDGMALKTTIRAYPTGQIWDGKQIWVCAGLQ